MWSKVHTMQKKCFPLRNTANQRMLYQTDNVDNMWYMYTVMKKIASDNQQEREVLGSLNTIIDRYINNSRSVGIWNVCSNRNYAVKGVCQTLLAQTILDKLRIGERNFYLKVRIGSIQNNTTTLQNANWGAIKCYLKCGFRFYINFKVFPQSYADTLQLLQQTGTNFRNMFIRAWTQYIGNEQLKDATIQNEYLPIGSNYQNIQAISLPMICIFDDPININGYAIKSTYNLPIASVPHTNNGIISINKLTGYQLVQDYITNKNGVNDLKIDENTFYTISSLQNSYMYEIIANLIIFANTPIQKKNNSQPLGETKGMGGFKKIKKPKSRRKNKKPKSRRKNKKPKSRRKNKKLKSRRKRKKRTKNK